MTRYSSPGAESGRKMPLQVGATPRTPFLIGVAGGTASGKSSVCKILMESLGQNEMRNPQLVSLSQVQFGAQFCVVQFCWQDSFYRELSDSEIALANKGMFNFDHPDAFDNELMEAVLQVRFLVRLNPT